MEFDFSCEQVTKADKYGYSIVDSDKLLSLPKKSYEYIETLVDVMGKYSSKAQRLPSVITSFKKLQMNTDNQRVYFYSKKNKCFGYLKTGNKKLFVSTEFGEIKEINPLCVLDFYVSEEVQRQGIGKKLFDLMLSDSKARPEKLAYDRPSEKLLKFLSKHFGLKRYLPQNNNFVVFSQYFSANFKSKAGGIYESKPSYKVTYDKGERKEYDQTNNIVNQDYITNLITSSQDSNTKIRKMAANEESKNGFNQIHEGAEAHKDNISEFNFQEKTEEEYRKPLVDTTNETRDIDNNYNNPITGLGYKSDKQVIIEKPIPVSPYADVEMKPEESTDPSGPELDRLIERKEKELQE
mmetsp:Transcript_16030/g.14010  ORF Transcript_16030/g.14010 Transcript_16030/m.14010 type:complete len:351 (+) Transcript_16030:28-1080(+)